MEEQNQKVIFAFLKYSELKYLQNLQKGEMYFNKIQYFAEAKEDDGIGDRYENVYKVTNGPGATIDMRKESHDSSIRMEGQPDGNFRSTYVNNEHYVNIFCLYSVVDDFNFENQKDVWLSAKMQGRYRHFLLIVNPKEFLNRVRAVLDTMYKNTHYDKIKYCDIENRLGRKNCFEKPLKLSYQNEYRIAFQNTRENEEIINIGSIEDISIIMSVEECNRITLHQNQVTLLERLDKIRETHFSDCIKTHLLYEDLLRKAESNPNVENLSLLRDAKDALLAAQKNFYEFCASIRIH